MNRPRTLVTAILLLASAVAPQTAIGTSSTLAIQERTEPRVTKRVEPEYPAEEKEKGTEGRVVIEAQIFADGSIEIIRVVRSLGQVMDKSAIEALEQWEFEPGTVDGEPIDRRVRIDVNFSLADRNLNP